MRFTIPLWQVVVMTTTIACMTVLTPTPFFAFVFADLMYLGICIGRDQEGWA